MLYFFRVGPTCIYSTLTHKCLYLSPKVMLHTAQAPAHRLAIKTVKWCSTPKLVNV